MRGFRLVALVAVGLAVALDTASAIPASPATLSTNSAALTVTPAVPEQPIPTYIPPSAPSKAPVTKIFEYSGVGFEDLAFRSNGQILATVAFSEGLLFYIDPLQIRPGIVLHNFTSLQSTGDIRELARDIFYIHGTGRDGVSSVYSIDMRLFVISPDGSVFNSPVIKEVGRMPDALLLNGMTIFRRSDNFVLIADTLLGGVWKFYVDTGKHNLVIKDPSMAGPANKTAFAAFGINGIRTQNNTLFYCNSGAQSFYRMPLHQDGSSAGKAKLITSDIACDDFALDPWGFAYVASPRNALIKLDTRTGAQLVIAGNFNESFSEIISASSAQFGVGDSDRTSVYVTTNGGAFVGAPPGSQGISRVDVSGLAQIFRCSE